MGTVEWRFKNAKHIQPLFHTEFESLLESMSVTKTVRGEDIILNCKYPEYKSTKSLLEDVEKEIKRYKGKQLKKSLNMLRSQNPFISILLNINGVVYSVKSKVPS